VVGDDMQLRFRFRSLDGPSTIQMLQAMLEGLTQHNEIWMRQHPEVPCCLAHANVEYVDPMLCKDKDFCQVILAADKLLEHGVGTCADMSAYVAAWIRSHLNQPAYVVLEQQYDQYSQPIDQAYHAYVISNGVRYDPSEEVKAGICRCPGGAQ